VKNQTIPNYSAASDAGEKISEDLESLIFEILWLMFD
jgi:hypothetical protein